MRRRYLCFGRTTACAVYAHVVFAFAAAVTSLAFASQARAQSFATIIGQPAETLNAIMLAKPTQIFLDYTNTAIGPVVNAPGMTSPAVGKSLGVLGSAANVAGYISAYQNGGGLAVAQKVSTDIAVGSAQTAAGLAAAPFGPNAVIAAKSAAGVVTSGAIDLGTTYIAPQIGSALAPYTAEGRAASAIEKQLAATASPDPFGLNAYERKSAAQAAAAKATQENNALLETIKQKTNKADDDYQAYLYQKCLTDAYSIKTACASTYPRGAALARQQVASAPAQTLNLHLAPAASPDAKSDNPVVGSTPQPSTNAAPIRQPSGWTQASAVPAQPPGCYAVSKLFIGAQRDQFARELGCRFASSNAIAPASPPPQVVAPSVLSSIAMPAVPSGPCAQIGMQLAQTARVGETAQAFAARANPVLQSHGCQNVVIGAPPATRNPKLAGFGITRKQAVAARAAPAANRAVAVRTSVKDAVGKPAGVKTPEQIEAARRARARAARARALAQYQQAVQAQQNAEIAQAIFMGIVSGAISGAISVPRRVAPAPARGRTWTTVRSGAYWDGSHTCATYSGLNDIRAYRC